MPTKTTTPKPTPAEKPAAAPKPEKVKSEKGGRVHIDNTTGANRHYKE